MARTLVQRYRHAQLLAVLSLLLLVNPFVQGLGGSALLDVVLFLALVSAVVACGRERRQVVIGISLAGLLQAVALYRNFTGITAVGVAYSTLGVVFFGYVTVLIVSDIFRTSRPVSADTICGALSAYLLMGVGWAFAYALLEQLIPGSIRGLRGPGDGGYAEYLGYSFVTLTTLGYGNVVPGNEKADALAVAEAIVGQVYLTVLVARLVALNLVFARGGDDDQKQT